MGVEQGSGVGCSEESLLGDDLNLTLIEFVLETEFLELLLGLLDLLLEVVLVESEFVSLFLKGFLLIFVEWAFVVVVIIGFLGVLTIIGDLTIIILSLLGESDFIGFVIGGHILGFLLLSLSALL